MHCRVEVPASSANLGPGFDTMAVALDLFLTVDVALADDDEQRVVEGPDLCGGADLVLAGMHQAAREAGHALPGCRLRVHSQIPVARGLGSSAAALVAGLLAGNLLLGDPLDRATLFRLAASEEGHGDNVAAAMFGGVALAVPEPSGARYHGVPVASDLRAIVFVPEQTSFTHDARAVIPPEVPREDAVGNAARCALLVLALTTGRFELLGEAMLDRLHQPYRVRLFPHLPSALAAAVASGAYGACLSGAGPSILALASPRRAPEVAAAMCEAAREMGVQGKALDLAIVAEGARVTSLAGGLPEGQATRSRR